MLAESHTSKYEIKIRGYVSAWGTGYRRYIKAIVGPETLFLRVRVNFFTLDDYENEIVLGVHILSDDIEFNLGVPNATIPTFDPATTAFIIGINSFDMTNGQVFSFDFSNSPADQVTFDAQYGLNSLHFLGLQKLSCGGS